MPSNGLGTGLLLNLGWPEETIHLRSVQIGLVHFCGQVDFLALGFSSVAKCIQNRTFKSPSHKERGLLNLLLKSPRSIRLYRCPRWPGTPDLMSPSLKQCSFMETTVFVMRHGVPWWFLKNIIQCFSERRKRIHPHGLSVMRNSLEQWIQLIVVCGSTMKTITRFPKTRSRPATNWNLLWCLAYGWRVSYVCSVYFLRVYSRIFGRNRISRNFWIS